MNATNIPTLTSDERRQAINALQEEIIACERCPRLIDWCRTVARDKVKRFAHEEYWGKPAPSFGDPNARLIIVGLAPAAHGANRTGRVFTGDKSGDWLYRALHKAGFANQPTSVHKDDGLELIGSYITAAAHCAPPANKPTPEELKNCRPFVEAELRLLDNARVYLALGKIGFDMLVSLLQIPPEWLKVNGKPKFGHGAMYPLPEGRYLLASFHPSQQNTFTGKLTEPMFDEIFNTARRIIES